MMKKVFVEDMVKILVKEDQILFGFDNLFFNLLIKMIFVMIFGCIGVNMVFIL